MCLIATDENAKLTLVTRLFPLGQSCAQLCKSSVLQCIMMVARDITWPKVFAAVGQGTGRREREMERKRERERWRPLTWE